MPSTQCLFKVTYCCGEGCRGCRKETKKGLEEAYGESIKFDMVKDMILAEGDAIFPAKIIAVLQKLKKVMKAEHVAPPKKDSTGTGGSGGGGGSNANGAKVPNNGGYMGPMVPPMDNYFSDENANGCTVM